MVITNLQIIYKKCIEIEGKLRRETIQGILFDILLMESRIEIYGILIRKSKKLILRVRYGV